MNGPEDAVVSEMIKQLPLQERLMGQTEAPSSWKIVKLEFLRKLDVEPKKGNRSYRAIALTLIMSKWFASCVILRSEHESEPETWKKLRVGGMNGISC